MIRRDGSCLKRSSSFISFFAIFASLYRSGGGRDRELFGRRKNQFSFFRISVVQGRGGHEKRSERLVSLSFLAPDSQIAIFFSRVEGEGENPFFSSLFFFWPHMGKSACRPEKKEGPTSKRQTASRFPYEKNNKCFFFGGMRAG